MRGHSPRCSHLVRRPRARRTPGPDGIREGEGSPGEVPVPRASPRFSAPRSPRPFRPRRPASRSGRRPRPEARERGPVSLNLKSRAGSSFRDLRGRIHISHNSLSFLLPPAAKMVSSLAIRVTNAAFGSIRCHPSRGAAARGSLYRLEEGEPRGGRHGGAGSS